MKYVIDSYANGPKEIEAKDFESAVINYCKNTDTDHGIVVEVKQPRKGDMPPCYGKHYWFNYYKNTNNVMFY